MPGEETILEGPVTPAPVFAYRAIRSVFFASPDSSPDSSPEHGGKENLVPSYSSSPSPKPKPLAELQLSPSQKRKRGSNTTGAGNILSPTKGILRTPGLATPRAKYLKDINVKFKSVSPEGPKSATLPVSPKQPKTKLQHAPPAPHPSKSSIELASPTRKKASSKWQDPLQDEPLTARGIPATTATTTPTSPCILSRAAIEAYVTQTEKEMKKLVRYGQKMREYARKKDAENQELKAMIEQLQRENGRLKRGAESATDCQFSANHPPQLQVQPKDNGQDRRASVRTVETSASPALRHKPRGYVREEVDRVETTVRSQTTRDSKDHRHTSLSNAATAEQSGGVCEPPKPPPSGWGTIASEHPPTLKRSTSTPTPKRTTSSSARLLVSLPSNSPASSEIKPATTCMRSASASTTLAARPAATRLPPERIAAARDRIRRRNEARKASVQVDVAASTPGKKGEGHAPHNGRELVLEQEMGQQPEEPSEVDWANL
ncbi:hypothetical protein AYO20_08793 [Fonsecaea nubica]|uniref:Spindle pole body-associated protein cut12 domain-containing protein n=1 Tax=Fonsecaea nubica TaxID=856822 RepID=A0A178CMT9_9EURO|nr:hypothetical protein AYO20_08793 [Fonsecaea nubica]OAL30315.1 hypothetical protein AYO20_08793 [Fonsecaea nubica]